MEIILLGIATVSLVVALVMSVAAWRVTRAEKKRSAARVAALSLAANTEDEPSVLESFPQQEVFASPVNPAMKAPWAPAELPLNEMRSEPARFTHASGFLGAEETPRDSGSRQKTLAFAAVILFAVLSGGLVWMMSGPEGTSAAAVGPNSPLELMSLSHQRQGDKLAVSGLVRNPAAGQPIQKLSAVVFLFDRMGTFVTSSRANVDFLKLGAGDESPFVVSLDGPTTVARYRVSFRTDDGVVPHVDRREETVGSQESAVKSSVVSRQ